MFCPNCGIPNPENQKACSRCGAQLPISPAQQPPSKTNGILIAVIVILSVCLLALGAYLIYTLVSDAPESDPPKVSATHPTEETEKPSEDVVELPSEIETSMSEEASALTPSAPLDITSGDTQYRLNLFLSNFSEQHFDEYPDDDDFELVQFAYLYHKINANENIGYDEGSYCIRGELVNETLERFFGHTITHRTQSDTDDWGYTRVFEYRDGTYYTPAADGEAYNCFTVATDAKLIEDGTYLVYFSVYELDLDIYFQNGITDEYYALTADEASVASDLTYCYSGQAIVRDYDLGGYETYQLISYDYDD